MMKQSVISQMLSEQKYNAFTKRMKKNKSLRKRVAAFQEGQRRCLCCNVQLNWSGTFQNSATVEHLVPKSKGGTFDSSNILVVCKKCNEARDVKDWVDWVEENDFENKEYLISYYLKSVDLAKLEVTQEKENSVYTWYENLMFKFRLFR